ncbi:hypothetical protein HaLaN_26099, partial [Haematococcus lacustris]
PASREEAEEGRLHHGSATHHAARGGNSVQGLWCKLRRHLQVEDQECALHSTGPGKPGAAASDSAGPCAGHQPCLIPPSHAAGPAARDGELHG